MDSSRPDQPDRLSLVLVNRADFCLFYDAYAPRLYGHLLGRDYPVATAQRLLEQAFNRCWQDRDQLKRDQSGLFVRYPLSWLLYQTQQLLDSQGPI